MTSQNFALWSLINTQSKGGYSNRKKGRYRKLMPITFDWIGIFWWGFQQNNSLKAFYQHHENQEYFKFLYICPLSYYYIVQWPEASSSHGIIIIMVDKWNQKINNVLLFNLFLNMFEQFFLC